MIMCYIKILLDLNSTGNHLCGQVEKFWKHEPQNMHAAGIRINYKKHVFDILKILICFIRHMKKWKKAKIESVAV